MGTSLIIPHVCRVNEQCYDKLDFNFDVGKNIYMCVCGRRRIDEMPFIDLVRLVKSNIDSKVRSECFVFI